MAANALGRSLFREYVERGDCWEQGAPGHPSRLKSPETISLDLNIATGQTIRRWMFEEFPELAKQWPPKRISKAAARSMEHLMRTSRNCGQTAARLPPIISTDEFEGSPQGILHLTRKGQWIIKEPKT